MVVIRCTREVAERHKLGLEPDPSPSANRLGEWAMALAKTPGRELVAFVNARTFLLVVCPPAEIGDLLMVFKARLAGLLEEIGVLEEEVEGELDEMVTMAFAAAGEPEWLRDATAALATATSRGVVTGAESLDLWQRDWAHQPRAVLGGRRPAELVRRALKGKPTVH
jgi:hypothetical protein